MMFHRYTYRSIVRLYYTVRHKISGLNYYITTPMAYLYGQRHIYKYMVEFFLNVQHEKVSSDPRLAFTKGLDL